MSMTAEEARTKLKAAQAREQLRTAQSTQPESSGGNILSDMVSGASRNIAQPFNEGLMTLLGALPGGDDLQQSAEHFNMVAPEGQEATGIIPRISRIGGASALPGGLISGFGRQVLAKGVPVAANALRNAPQLTDDVIANMPWYKNLVAQMAKSPKATAVGEIAATGGAGVGGEIGAGLSDHPAAETTGELVGGGIAALGPSVVRPTLQGGKWLAGKVADVAEKIPVIGAPVRAGRDIVGGYKTVTNPQYRAAKAAQSKVVDPEVAAANIDLDNPMPPARQINEPRMLAMEESLRRSGSAAESEAVDRHIAKTVADQKAATIDVGGDTQLPGKVLAEEGKQTVNRFKVKAEKAAAEADDAIAKMDSGASPRDVSRAERQGLEDAMTKGRAAEREAWDSIDQNHPAEANHTLKVMAGLEEAESDLVLSGIIPREVKALIKKYESTLVDGEKDVEFLLKDLQSVRSVIGDNIRTLRSDGKWNEARILGKFRDSLLDDMNEVDAPGIEHAREVSRIFNEKFTKGEVGKILKLQETGVKAVDDPETLETLLTGKSVSRGIQQFIKASPEAKNSIPEYIKNRFVVQAVKEDGSINQTTAKRAVDRLRSQGVFEEFPELEAELIAATAKSNKAVTMAARAEAVKKQGGVRFEKGQNKSLATLYNEGDVGKEAGLLLNSKKIRNPVQTARRLKAKMRGDEAAEEGLRQSFREALWNGAKGKLDDEGFDTHSAAKFSRLVRDHTDTMKALGFSDEHVNNMKRLALYMRQSVASADPADQVLSDVPGIILSSASQILGARMGNWVNKVLGGKGAGPGLQAAQLGSARAKQISSVFRVDPAEGLLRAAIDDPALMKALLTREAAPEAAKKAAASKLNAWAIGAGLTDDEESEP